MNNSEQDSATIEATIPLLPAEHTPVVLQVIRTAFNADASPVDHPDYAHIVSARAGHVYDRKGQVTLDALDRPRNPIYGSDTDDVLVSLTVQLSRQAAVDYGIIAIGDDLRAKREAVNSDERAAEIEQLHARLIELGEDPTRKS